MIVIMHSCCPGKVDINAPLFKLVHEYMRFIEYKCEGCGTVIFLRQEL